MRYTLLLATVLAFMFISSVAEAKVQTKSIDYGSGGDTFEGFIAWDDSFSGPRPAVLIVHQWMGLSDNERMRAGMLAELGYVAFAADVYGKGVRPATNEEAGAQAGALRGDVDRFRQRLNLSLDTLRNTVPGVAGVEIDQARVAAIGYCFGGGGVIELARSGAELAGVVSFHGSLETGKPLTVADKGRVVTPILVLHGADDKNIADGQLPAFMDEMRGVDADYEINLYGGAVHAFTQKGAGSDPSKGVAYDETADLRSWAQMRLFFDEVLGAPNG